MYVYTCLHNQFIQVNFNVAIRIDKVSQRRQSVETTQVSWSFLTLKFSLSLFLVKLLLLSWQFLRLWNTSLAFLFFKVILNLPWMQNPSSFSLGLASIANNIPALSYFLCWDFFLFIDM